MPDKNKIVYSTDPDWKPEKKKSPQRIGSPKPGETAYIERDRKQRKGKTVTVVSGLSGELKDLQKALQKFCGAGGSFKEGRIEIQGDHRDKIGGYLQEKGFRIKFRGG
jgi:translation initiation factor 1